jgi:hypothetical protein
MISLADVISDPDFAQSFTVTRTNGKFVAGGFQTTVKTLQAYGIIQPATSKDLEQIPEGDRVQGMMAFYTTIQVYTTSLKNQGLSDQITWDDEQWRLQYVFEWQDFGYWKALGVRMSGA